MCGRYTQTQGGRKLQEHFNAAVQEVLPRFNVAPTQNALVIHTESPRTIAEMRWGFVPSWSSDSRSAQLLINAKSETIAEKRTFKGSFQSNRCLIVADSFYEWRRQGSSKQPVRFMLKTEEPFAFAGIWREVEAEKAFVIVTTEPNNLVRPVHDRMPVILPKEKYSEWLNNDAPPNQLLDCLRTFPAELMTSYDVDPVVGSPKVDSPQCIALYQPVQGSLF
ncbi:MAG: SOS response-associated peptidase [Verrucomicrobia bacterium]|nr:SOS response-associated peptidase [Verrucomicrobiota bacterium]